MATSLPPKVIELIIRLHLFITGAERKKDASGKKVDNPEVENAEDQLDKVLKKHGLSRNDIHGIVAAKAIADDKAKAAAEAAADEAARREGWKNGAFDDLGVEIPNNDILALLIATVEQFVHAEPEEILTLCLWIMHTAVYDRFSITPRLFIRLNNLASLLKDPGDLAAARPLYERALAICEKVLGPEHPNTAMALNNLARLLHDQGDLAAARPLYECGLATPNAGASRCMSPRVCIRAADGFGRHRPKSPCVHQFRQRRQ